jgi:putative DNA methylase
MSKMPKMKLIEVALPLEVINKAAARETPIEHGQPRTVGAGRAKRSLATVESITFAKGGRDVFLRVEPH